MSQLDSLQSARGQPFKQGKLTVVHRRSSCWHRNSCVGAVILTGRARLSEAPRLSMDNVVNDFGRKLVQFRQANQLFILKVVVTLLQ